jgi:hypothetical protein
VVAGPDERKSCRRSANDATARGPTSGSKQMMKERRGTAMVVSKIVRG